MKRVPVVFLLLLLSGFIQTEKKKDAPPPVPAFFGAKDLKITINYFNEKSIPGQLGGDCSERYAFDTLALFSGNMMLFTDLGSLAIMKINYRLISFKIDHVEMLGTQRTTFFSGEGYTIKFVSKELKKLGDEYFVRGGTLEISKNGQKKIFNVLGKYGC
ncbi:MAG: hypothetical protein V4557_04285 [Bacteroidota bacterium]